jgi:hypothetical protein
LVDPAGTVFHGTIIDTNYSEGLLAPSADQRKKGGWRTCIFMNEGDGLTFVATGGKIRRGIALDGGETAPESPGDTTAACASAACQR